MDNDEQKVKIDRINELETILISNLVDFISNDSDWGDFTELMEGFVGDDNANLIELKSLLAEVYGIQYSQYQSTIEQSVVFWYTVFKINLNGGLK